MSFESITANPAARRSRRLRRGVLAAVMLVPLAFTGLVVAAVSQGDSPLDGIPAAIVNEDELIMSTLPDGTEQAVFAGRQLVTELTGDTATGFDWSITNAEAADAALAAGEVYAVLTIPQGFSEAVLSISTDEPVKADIGIRTDDAHSYVTGALAQVVGDTLARSFGTVVTEQFIGGIYASIGDVGSSLATAADGATQLSDGVSELGAGLGELASGAAAAQDGAAELSGGVARYTSGVSALSSGLAQLDAGAAGLTRVGTEVGNYTAGIAGIRDQLAAAVAQLQTTDPSDAAAYAAAVTAVSTASATLSFVVDQAAPLAPATAGAIAGVQGGIGESARGAAQLASGGAALASGATGLAGGLEGLAAGATEASAGAGELATGAGQLASGLTAGSEQVPSFDEQQTEASAAVAAQPVTVSVTRDNPVDELGQAIATLLAPLGLWLGALAVFLVLRPVTRRALASTARDGRLVRSLLARALAVTAAQAVLLVALLHVSLGVEWAFLPATLGFALVMAAVFTAIHAALTIAFGRAGLIVSLFLFAVQITATGGVYPIEILAAPFQAVSPVLPLTYGVSGMQAIIAGGSPATVSLAVVVLLAFGFASVVVALTAVRRKRQAAARTLVPATA